MSKPALPCTEHDPEMWFPAGSYEIPLTEVAKRWCHTCPIEQACLQRALDEGIDFGVWGGTTPTERRAIKRRNEVAAVQDLRDLDDVLASAP